GIDFEKVQMETGCDCAIVLCTNIDNAPPARYDTFPWFIMTLLAHCQRGGKWGFVGMVSKRVILSICNNCQPGVHNKTSPVDPRSKKGKSTRSPPAHPSLFHSSSSFLMTVSTASTATILLLAVSDAIT